MGSNPILRLGQPQQPNQKNTRKTAKRMLGASFKRSSSRHKRYPQAKQVVQQPDFHPVASMGEEVVFTGQSFVPIIGINAYCFIRLFVLTDHLLNLQGKHLHGVFLMVSYEGCPENDTLHKKSIDLLH